MAIFYRYVKLPEGIFVMPTPDEENHGLLYN